MANRSQTSTRTLVCRSILILLACITTLPQWTLHSHASSLRDSGCAALHTLHLRIHHSGSEDQLPSDTVHVHCVPDAFARNIPGPTFGGADLADAQCMDWATFSLGYECHGFLCDPWLNPDLGWHPSYAMPTASGRRLRALHCVWHC